MFLEINLLLWFLKNCNFLFQFPNLNKLSIVGVIIFFFIFSNLIQVQVIVIHSLYPDNFIHGLALITLKTRQLFFRDICTIVWEIDDNAQTFWKSPRPMEAKISCSEGFYNFTSADLFFVLSIIGCFSQNITGWYFNDWKGEKNYFLLNIILYCKICLHPWE